MKRYFHNKILLAFLFAVLCFSSISVASSAEDELEGFRIETEDQAVQELILMQDQKALLCQLGNYMTGLNHHQFL